MKRVIKSARYFELDGVHKVIPKELKIEIEFEPIVIRTSTIRPIGGHDGVPLDEKALAEYNDFILDVMMIFEDRGYETIEDSPSPMSESRYFTLYNKIDSTADNIKCLIFWRISDHKLPKDREVRQRRYYANKAEELKRPKSKSRQNYRLKEIIVNSDTFESYDAALDAIRRMM